MKRLNNNWEYIPVITDAFLHGEGQSEIVRLPHNVNPLPLHYADSESYQRICGYRKTIHIPEEWKQENVYLQFDGAAHIAKVYCNGHLAGEHRCGYTAFRILLDPYLVYGEDNRIVVQLDTTENEAIPPFGFVIDYLTYGGLYRDVWLDVRKPQHIEQFYAASPTLSSVYIQAKCSQTPKDEMIRVTLRYKEEIRAREVFPATLLEHSFSVENTRAWSCENPILYTCTLELLKDNDVLDTVSTNFAFRTVEFSDQSFILNGRPYFLRGLNRHQSWPYIGYAATASLQREDARILKEELGVNAVRTSHYPQSQDFLDECDRLGLLVFTEIPGWQHIGDTNWKKQALENTREMVLQNRNHPSIFIWGVRINESIDSDGFYRKTNRIAHRLDPFRATTGVRYLKKSSLLEDVYSFNDFSHDGSGSGVLAKKDVVDPVYKPLLITEANGHMFPTKAFDSWDHRQEHALRHARVLNDAMRDGMHAGCFQWCMFDYNTHKDFGSGDRICYHGVMDSFRNPKLAAYLYAAQQDEIPVLELGSSMDIGDYPAGRIPKIYAFTNAERVHLYKNDQFVKTFTSHDFGALKHGPIRIDDLIGNLFIREEGYGEAQAKLLSSIMRDCLEYGSDHLPAETKTKIAYVFTRYHMSEKELTALYTKYITNWGTRAVKWTLKAEHNGKIIKVRTYAPNTDLHLEVKVSSTQLHEGDTYDMSAVRIRLLDRYGNPAVYAQLPIRFRVKGPLELIGPDIATLEGGMSGTYVKTIGKCGMAKLIIECEETPPTTLTFHID